MSEMTHTSGEWEVFAEDNGLEYVVKSGEWSIAVVCDAAGDGDTKANAHLLAAAPELLEALVEWFFVMEDRVRLDGGEGLWALRLEKARAAIRKATGGAQ